METRNRFVVGTKVRIKSSGIAGEVIQTADAPSPNGEYWHVVKTQQGGRMELGSNLQLLSIKSDNPKKI